jgi:uncharacterized HAD superfamily protein
MATKLLQYVLQKIEKVRIEKNEKVLDAAYDIYYTQKATRHMQRVLKFYNRKHTMGFHESRKAMKSVGLFQPFADNIKYLQNARSVAFS